MLSTKPLPLLLLLLLLSTAESVLPASDAEHVWVVQIDAGHTTAQTVADLHRLENHGQIPYLRNKFVFKLTSPLRRTKRSLPAHLQIHRSLKRHPQVAWVSYQTELQREKRDFILPPSASSAQAQASPSRAARFRSPIRAVGDFSQQQLNANAGSIFRDPLWPQQWYLHDTRSSRMEPKLDLHVLPAWRKNFTGRGVVVAIVDDGLEWHHPDLRQNYEPAASFDYNRNVHDPAPVYKNLEDERHGTRCAGEVAMVANNSHCGVGIAYHAKVGGVKILDGKVSDLLEARGLTHAMDKVHVYSCSWGPTDDGSAMESPGPLAAEALEAGVRRGRGGLGSVYVWASGNGGAFGDNCNCDGYASSVYTLAVSSASQRLRPPWYSETCSATVATTFSSGTSPDEEMVSADIQHKCTASFSGTSASAPVAASIVALMLQANPNVTWRDVQHAIIWTTEVAPLKGNSGWQLNAAGHQYHHSFGFGLFNVGSLVDLVAPATWRSVPQSSVHTSDSWQCDTAGWRVAHSQAAECHTDIAEAASAAVRYLEHVQLLLQMRYTVRGALAVTLTSASGSVSRLLTPRSHDQSKDGLNWTFMTVHFWGERPAGRWSVRIEDRSKSTGNSGAVHRMQLLLHGTRTMPPHRRRAGGRRSYNSEYNSVANVHPTH